MPWWKYRRRGQGLNECRHSSPANAWGLISRCPQIEQRPPSMGWIASRQFSHTGRRDIRIKDSPQMRQSAGNNVAKRLSATSPAQEAKEDPLATVFASVARVLSSLLLNPA